MSESVHPENAATTDSVVAQSQPAEPEMTLSLAAQVECLLYAAKEPATLNALAAALNASIAETEEALEQLAEQSRWRGVRIQRHGNKVQLVTAPELAGAVQKFLGLEEVNRLSTAALETLAIIAYNQPITRPQIEMIRGVNCNGVMNTLEARTLIVELGRADTVGHPMRYGVSFEFLQYFGLKGTHELPPVQNSDVLPALAASPLSPLSPMLFDTDTDTETVSASPA
jgi:segregation and condensation protein B